MTVAERLEEEFNEDLEAQDGLRVENDIEDDQVLVSNWSKEQQCALLQALLFTSGAPLGSNELAEAAGLPREHVEDLLAELKEWLAEERSGLHLVKVAGKYQLRTKLEFSDCINRLRSEKPKRLSRPALETLAIVAYRQPLTRTDVEKIRGVDCTPTLKTLMERGLVKIVGYSSAVGQPAMYATTEEFLNIFGLDGLPELPALRDINVFEEDPGESSEEGLPGGAT